MSTTTKASDKSTFGVELEFLAVIPDNLNITPSYAVYQALQKPVSLACPFNCDQGRHDLRLPVDDETPSFWDNNKSDNSYRTWTVSRDCSVRLTDDEMQHLPNSHNFSDVEMPSRILDFNNPSPCPHNQTWPCNGAPLMWNYADEIAAIINKLQSCNQPGSRVFVNGTCGMHVHIGREKFGFNLDTTKNIMGMFTTFERCFDSLLPLDRISGYENEHATLPALQLTADARRSIAHWIPSPIWQYAQPPSIRQYDHLGHDLREAFDKTDYMTWNTLTRSGASIPFWLHRIYSDEITTFAQLGEYSEDHQSWLNLEHLVHGDTNKQTIEIRLHAGSLDTNGIVAWIDLLCNLSIYAESHTTTSVKTTLESSYANPAFTILDVARLVNASPATIAYYTAILSPAHHANIAATALHHQIRDELKPSSSFNTCHNISQTSPTRISSRILQKLASGRYGQFPVSFLKQVLPEGVVIGDSVKFLSDEMSDQDQEDWARQVEEHISEVKERENSRGGYLLENLFD
jgi:hypothetical protein